MPSLRRLDWCATQAAPPLTCVWKAQLPLSPSSATQVQLRIHVCMFERRMNEGEKNSVIPVWFVQIATHSYACMPAGFTQFFEVLGEMLWREPTCPCALHILGNTSLCVTKRGTQLLHSLQAITRAVVQAPLDLSSGGQQTNELYFDLALYAKWIVLRAQCLQAHNRTHAASASFSRR